MYVPSDCNILLISVCDLCYRKKIIKKWASMKTNKRENVSLLLQMIRIDIP